MNCAKELLGECHAAGFMVSNDMLNEGAMVVPAHDGLPDLEVLLTGDEAQAPKFMACWQDASHFGLDLEWKPTFRKGQPPSRAALLQICSGNRVLLFDLASIRRASPFTLPDGIQSFLQNKKHTFFGMGLLRDASCLAFEFDCVVQGVDFALRAWPDRTCRGLTASANNVLELAVKQSKKITCSNWDRRPLSLAQVAYAAEDAYLSWALACHFMSKTPVQPEWVLTEAELWGCGQKQFVKHGLCVTNPRHDWSVAADNYERMMQKNKAAKKEKKEVKGEEALEQSAGGCFSEDNFSHQGSATSLGAV